MKYRLDQVCSYCQITKPPKYKLSCEHFLCSDNCFNSLISEKTEGMLERYSLVACKVCCVKIDKELLIKLYGSEENFRREINISSKRFEKKLSCGCCSLDKPVSEFVTLECEHRMCKECFKEYLKVLVSEGKVGEDVLCFECSKTIDYNIIVHALDIEMREKYDKFMLRKLEATFKNEVYIACIGLDCEFGQFISVDREEYTCPECKTSFCAKCKKNLHPRLTCEQFKNRERIDPGTRKAIESGLAYFCPWCDVYILKDGGCKYITCASSFCQEKRGFCWDCKTKYKIVNKEKHPIHPCHTPDVISNKIKNVCRIF
jgi:IBR domain, a half RING-finger domain